MSEVSEPLDSAGCNLVIATADALAERGITANAPILLFLFCRDGQTTSLGTLSLERVRELLPIFGPRFVGFICAAHEDAELRELAESWNAMQAVVACARAEVQARG